MPKSRKPHAADIASAKMIRTANRFAVHMRLGPSEVRNTTCTDADHALAEADRMTRELGQFGRRACAYAITPENYTVHITPALLALAREIA
jgi:hypothetical protein